MQPSLGIFGMLEPRPKQARSTMIELCQLSWMEDASLARIAPLSKKEIEVSIRRGRFITAQIGAIALTIALAVGLTASVAITIRLLFAGR